MKRTLATATAFLVALSAAAPAAEPNAAAQQQEQQVLRAVKELQEQQTQIAANQAKLEEKLAVVAEAVRQARIYASRGGQGH